MITCDFRKTFGDFSYKANAQGLVLPIFESWGTETANYAKFVHFSFVFNHFASKTYKTRSLGYFQYFDVFPSVFTCFGS